ncbi:MAG: gliding motility-associated C-terminal domain-containing protein, partial [Crocinitomicaceae bacterium]|nr:gliding motility-associated C-terminal domain-containing protein [Crocinitomicaceae bacterium]
ALSAGTYTVTVTDQGGCSNSTTVTINEPTELTLTAGTINPANCGATDGSASVIASGGTGTLSYTWSPNVSSSASATNIAAGSYTVTVQDLNLCSETINIVVTSIGGPTVTLASSNDASCYGGNDGDATINVTGGTAPFTYVWSPSGGSGVSATNLSAGTYSASVTDDQGCVGSVNVIIGSPTQIVITETITDIICGSSLGQISTSVTGGDGTYSYDWLPNGETTSGISGLAVGTYSLEVTDGSGCSVLENYVISTSGTLTIVATPASTTINAGESVQLNASGATTYTWSPATGLSATDISDPIATPTSSITYTVTGSDANGCVGTALVNIYIPIDCGELFLPTVFSPNGTGPSSNNVLCVLGGCIAELNYAVYNRWGEKVFETTDNTICWDGMFKDKPVNSGVYAYKIYAVLFDGTTIEESGNLTIVR